jgi:hypothetical protein
MINMNGDVLWGARGVCYDPISLTAIGSIMSGVAAAGSAGATVYGASQAKKARSAMPAPKPREETPIPDEDDPRVREERERRIRERNMAGGRESTDLSTARGDYTGSVLGG